MSEWVKSEWADWYDEVLYLEKVTGEEFTKKYNELNRINGIHITASNIFPLRDLPPEPPLFNAFIFYKTKIKGIITNMVVL